MTEHPPSPSETPTAGELWLREELARLRARRGSPPAIVGFLTASQRRAGDVRRERPALARQARVWSGVGVLAAAAQPHPRRAVAWWSACVVMLDWHLGMLETPEGQPRPLGPADAVTLARAWAVPLAWDGPGPALVLAAWASDGLDGALARRTAPTRAGRDLEGLVDLCFAVAALRGLAARGAVGRGAVAAELARLGGGVAYALWMYFGRVDTPDPRVTRAARQTTPLRVAGLAAAGRGHRRIATSLLAAGSAWSVVATATSVRRG